MCIFCVLLTSIFFYFFPLPPSTQGKEAQLASVSAKNHHQHLFFRMLGQNNPYHKQRQRCLRQKIRSNFLAQVVISSSKNRKNNQRISVWCILPWPFFITMYKDFLHKETYTVLINSACSFNWNSFKSEVLWGLFMTRNKCKLFFIFKDSLRFDWHLTHTNKRVLPDGW